MNHQIDSEIYNQLKVIANKLMSGERDNHTLSPTDLVHEAFIRVDLPTGIESEDEHYVFILARQMRRLLVDYGRQYSSKKRGGSQSRVIYTDALGINGNLMIDFSLINDAINELALLDERAAKAIDLFYFTNVDRESAAKLLNISLPTLERDLRFAKAQITHFLSENG
ncbi:MAG: ECF-type sigma factor [Marinicella sp.]|nr:hypothetical protein [Xanthomonadales bacterium]